MYDLYNLYGPVSVITKEEDALNIADYKYQPRPTLSIDHIFLYVGSSV